MLYLFWKGWDTMKAMGLMRFGGPEVLQPVTLECPVCEAGQVLIRTEGVSVNYADLQTRRGTYHAAGGTFPVIPGLDAVGRIVEVGSGVRTGLLVGQRVIAFPHTGTYAEYVAADGDLVFPLDETVPLEQAIACPLVTFTSAMLLQKTAQFTAGETLVIHAASGGIGTTAIQMARQMGAGQIIGTVGSRRKVDAALAAGADAVICLADEAFPEEVHRLTDGKGADVILDSLGGAYTEQGMACLAPYGRMVVFGNASGGYSKLNTGLLHASCCSVRGFSIGSTRRMNPSWFDEVAPGVLEAMASGAVRIPVAAQFPLEDAAQAHALLESRTVTGKIILLAE